MGCQTAIVEKILARGGDYLLTLKGNHPLAHAAVVEHIDQRCFRHGTTSHADCDAFDGTHDRLVRRWVFASTEAAALKALSGWPGRGTLTKDKPPILGLIQRGGQVVLRRGRRGRRMPGPRTPCRIRQLPARRAAAKGSGPGC